MDCPLFIYIGNHGKQEGVEDYLALLKKVLDSRGFQVEVSSTLRTNSINIIIDEFTNYIENCRIAEFRKNNPNNQCVFLLTEFAERKFGVESFNHFGGLFDSAFIALINVCLRLLRDDFASVRISDFAVLLLYSPVLAIYSLAVFPKYITFKLLRRKLPGRRAKDFFSSHHRLIYFHMRYLGLKAHLKYADAVISSHDLIMPGFEEDFGVDGQKLQFLGVIYPELNKQHILESLMVGKKLFIEITGSVTKYRRKWINRINLRLKLLGINNVFGKCKALPFSCLASVSGKPPIRAAYSLHPPQTRNWKYCSPMRIYRALEIDHNLPVLTKHFAHHPIEDVTLLLKDWGSLVEMADMFHNKDAMLHFMETKIQTYNEIVKQRNDILAQSLKTLKKEERTDAERAHTIAAMDTSPSTS